MIGEIDIWRAANLLLAQHGSNAGSQATMQADTLAAKGDPHGTRLWLRIAHAIDDLQRQQRRFEEPLN
jgi:hypothetical protein